MELELKFRVADDAVDSLRRALLARGARSHRLRARYFDTDDGRLAAHQMALRLRQEDRRWVQALKGLGDKPFERLEHEVPVPSRDEPPVDAARHAGDAAGAKLQALLAEEPAQPLQQRYATDVRRLACTVDDADGSVLEVALDVGSVSAGGRSLPIVELEIELKAGRPQALFDFAAAWLAQGRIWLSTPTKAERGERLLHDRPAPPVMARSPVVGEPADSAALMRAVLRSALEQVLGNASEIAEHGGTAEQVHQLRVGLRRLRTALRELAVLLPGVDTTAWHDAIGLAFAQLGARRDSETVAEAVRPLLEAASAPLLSWPADGNAVDSATAVRAAPFQRTLLELVALLHADDDRFAALGPDATRAVVADRLAALHRRVGKRGRRFAKLPVEQQHRVRKQLKRLRYLAEFSGSLWHDDAALARYLKRLKPAQDALGAHNDVVVAAERFRQLAADDPRAWFAAGWLQSHLDLTARDARKALTRVERATPFWKG